MIKNQEVLPAIDNEEKKEEVINAKVDQVEVEEKSGENPSITWTGLNNTGVLDFPTGKANMKVLSYTIK